MRPRGWLLFGLLATVLTSCGSPTATPIVAPPSPTAPPAATRTPTPTTPPTASPPLVLVPASALLLTLEGDETGYRRIPSSPDITCFQDDRHVDCRYRLFAKPFPSQSSDILDIFLIVLDSPRAATYFRDYLGRGTFANLQQVGTPTVGDEARVFAGPALTRADRGFRRTVLAFRTLNVVSIVTLAFDASTMSDAEALALVERIAVKQALKIQ